MGFRISSFTFTLPFGIGGVSVVRTEVQLRAAWSLYVEYSTRISTQPLEPGHGSIREALDSLHALFAVTRTLLKDLGPGVAEGPDSVGPLAIRILNNGVRPFLVEWHTKLSAFETEEALRQQENLGRGATPVIDEANWRDAGAFYDALESFRGSMLVYVGALETLAGLKEPA